MLFGSSRPYPRIRRSVLSKFCRFVFFITLVSTLYLNLFLEWNLLPKNPDVVICQAPKEQRSLNSLRNTRIFWRISERMLYHPRRKHQHGRPWLKNSTASASTKESGLNWKRWDNTCKWDNSNPRSTYWFISSHFFEWEVRCASDVYSILIFFWIRRFGTIQSFF